MNRDTLPPYPRTTLAGPLLAVALTLLAPPAPRVEAARISEPDTVLYGRVVERVGTREFTLSSGELVWKLRTTGPGGRDLSLRTRLERLADGRYSYRLRIPHELLAYDLSVKSNAVALANAGTQIRHVAITLNGRPLTVAADAVDGLALDPSRRAGTRQVNLELTGESKDTDADGAPDDWEDANGYDKFDPTDTPRDPDTPASPSPGTAASDGASTASAPSPVRTFAEWRTAWFPGATEDLDVFGRQDADGDGVINFLEYAFNLDPTQPDTDKPNSLPKAVNHLGRPGVAFNQRAGATDLTWQVETSDDLFHWSPPTGDVEELTATDDGGARIVVSSRATNTPDALRFFRVRVDRHP